MRRVTQTLLFGVLVLALAAVSATSAGATRGGTDRPFEASGNGIGIIAEIPAGCDFTNASDLVCDQEISMDFIGTHIGRATYTSTGQLTVHLDEPCTTVNGNPGGFQFDSFQVGAIVAANGDELWHESSVSGCGDGVSLAEPVGTYTIDGGTGRFEDAAGTGTIEATALADGTLSNRWSGLITY
jgi:hypothetical protein